MDSAEIGEYIESVAVRIELGGTGCVAGTGVLYTLQAEKRAVILTAGHVLSKNVTGTNTCQAILSVRVQDTVKDMELTLSGVESGGTPNVYFCPGFQKDHNDRYLFDGAMIEVGWEDWMKDVPELQLARARISMKLQTIGFPESGDVQVPPNNRIQGRKSLKAEISGSAEPAASLYLRYCLTAKCSGSFSSRRSNMRSTGFWKSSSSSRASDAFIISSSVVKFFSSSGASYQI